jgi:hypothetical protein
VLGGICGCEAGKAAGGAFLKLMGIEIKTESSYGTSNSADKRARAGADKDQ